MGKPTAPIQAHRIGHAPDAFAAITDEIPVRNCRAAASYAHSLVRSAVSHGKPGYFNVLWRDPLREVTAELSRPEPHSSRSCGPDRGIGEPKDRTTGKANGTDRKHGSREISRRSSVVVANTGPASQIASLTALLTLACAVPGSSPVVMANAFVPAGSVMVTETVATVRTKQDANCVTTKRIATMVPTRKTAMFPSCLRRWLAKHTNTTHPAT